MRLGITGPFIDALKLLYDATQSSIKLGNYMTDMFPVQYGVKQGCKMSPTLYSVYINDLAEDINALGAGINIDDDVNLAILLYADDVTLIAPDENSLQRMLDVVNRWCRKWRMTLNHQR